MRAWLALLLVAPLLAGCFGDDDPDRIAEPTDVGYDATEVRVQGVEVEEVTIPGHDGAALDAIVYRPTSTDTIDGDPARFPVVVMMHPFGFPKETYNYLPLADETNDSPLATMTDVMQEFAEGGIIAVSFDTRGWFRSAGTSDLAGPSEQADMDAVLDYMAEHYPTNGMFGATGHSYGGGKSFLAWANNDRIATAVPMSGWVDLYEAIAPGNVPKLEWASFLVPILLVDTHVTGTPDDLLRWIPDALLRSNMEELEAEFDQRSIMTGSHVDKPLFTCQPLQESLFHQTHLATTTTPAFERNYYYTGGHNDLDRGCWTKALQWFQFFLAGIDTKVDEWPLIDAIGIDGEQRNEYARYPHENVTLFLDDPLMSEARADNFTFTISQNLLSNPIHEPSVVWDTVGLPFQDVPEQLRQDPVGTWFYGPVLEATDVVLGAPDLILHADNATRDGPWQVVATLYLESEGTLQMLGRGAYAALDADDHDNGTVKLTFPWTNALTSPGDRIVLKLASNDPTIFAPLFNNYSVTFDEKSRLILPLFAGE